MAFPQLSNIAKEFVDTINSRAGNNVKASSIMPWVRITSTLGDFLSIESSRDTETFAQRYGNTERSGRIGINKNKDSVYEEDDSRGFRPSPTINDISISQGNEGLSKKTSFTIIAYSIGQAERLMEYFLEPGNMCLVEWGENTNESISQKTELDTCEIAAYNNLKHIQDKRASSKGTYDAILGTITGGDVKFGSNETYEINVQLTSIGEMPAYLQHHKNISSDTSDPNDTGKTFSKTKIDSESGKDNGKSLFMQMFNDLPQHKRTEDVRNLIDESWATDSINFVNIDKEIQEKFAQGFGGDDVKVNGKKVEIPSDTPLFSDKRFIRCALAFTILEMQPDVDITSTKGECPKTNSSSGKIRWQNTICRAHRHMFSANSDFLYIPNKQAPSFDLVGALLATGSITNPIPNFESLEDSNFQADLHPEAPEKYSYFPNERSIKSKDSGLYDNQAIPYEADKGEWGFLKDLYINFDFFIDCLNSSGLVTKEVWYKILNGMSSAVNLYWNFQILPRGRVVDINKVAEEGPFNEGDKFYEYYLKNERISSQSNIIGPIDQDGNYYENAASIDTGIGDEELQIVDVSFIGNTPSGVGKAKFQSRGLNTPFLECSFNLDIPGAMKGQVIGNKLSSDKNTPSTNPNPEQKEINFEGLFTDKKDSVLRVLNPTKTKEEIEKSNQSEFERRVQEKVNSGWLIDSAKRRVESEMKKERDQEVEENKKQNFEMFVGTATIIPRIQDRNAKKKDIKTGFWDWNQSDNIDLDEFAVVCAWNDSALLKVVQRFDDGFHGASKANESVSNITQKNVPLLPIKFDFTIHGVSGLKVGDTFNIKDLPQKYKEYIFQITEIEHTISQNIWTTKVNGSFRQMKSVEDNPSEYKKLL